jgi:flagellar basal-body rod protein FlgG
MVRGFYMLTSGMLTQNRTLNTISNNVANTMTNGFKAQHVSGKSFGKLFLSRVDSKTTPIGEATLMTTVDQVTTDFSQGALQPTENPLDFVINGDGFFGIQTNNGVVYTRNGSFNLDPQGYLVLNGVGRVLGRNGQPIRTDTDNVESDKQGDIFVNGTQVGSLGVFRFPNNASLRVVDEGFYSGTGAVAVQTPQVTWKAVEGSNADMAEELTRGIASQRSLQSCSQVLKMYDQVLDKATEIGKV